MASRNENSFWDYSYALHESDGVGPACIELQDRHGLDVNLLLFCCWTAASGRQELDVASLEKARSTVAGWQNRVSSPIREIRRLLKTDSLGVPDDLAQAFRKNLMSVELESEKVAQDALVTVAPPPEGGVDFDERGRRVWANLNRYLTAMGVECDGADDAALAKIADAALVSIRAQA